MTRKAKICQSVVLVYLACSIVSGLVLLAQRFSSTGLRGQGVTLLGLVLRWWFFSRVLQRAKAWIWTLGFFAAFAAVFQPLWIIFVTQLSAPEVGFAWYQPRIVINEIAFVICAAGCFILEAELRAAQGNAPGDTVRR